MTRPVLASLGLAALPALLLAARTATPAPPSLALERKIPLPDVRGRIDHLSVDPASQRLFVAALGNDTVEVVDLVAGRRAQTLRGLAEPQGVLVMPELNRLVVANGRDGTVRTFDATSLAPLPSFPLGDDADNVRRGAESMVWVGYGGGALRAIDLARGAVGVDIPIGAHPESFRLDERGTRAYVNVPGAGAVAVVDLARGKVLSRWKTADAAANYPMALDEVDHRLFVVCRTPPRLLVFDTGTGAVVAERPTVGDSDDVFYDAATRRLYVSGGEGALAVYAQRDRDHYDEISRLPTVKGARTSLFSPELRRLFLAVRSEGGNPAAIWVFRTDQ
jgi:DNA-binding beta-propeller fold protein YncE